MADDVALLEDDRRAREAALDPRRSFIVQAPAGSGKTELLIQRYLVLLGTVEDPEEVLAITFTKKAAQEMRQRVVEAIGEAAAGVQAAEPHRRATLEAARRVLERERRHDWGLVQSPRRMRIQTMDALNASIARSLPLSSGLGGSSRIAGDEEQNGLYRAAAAATLDWLAADGEPGTSVEAVLEHLDASTSAYVEHLARMLAKRDQWLGLTGSGGQVEAAGEMREMREVLEGNVAMLVDARLAAAQEALPPSCREPLLALGRHAACNLGKAGHPCAILETVSAWPRPRAGELATWRALAELLLTRRGTLRRTVDKSIGFPPGDHGEKARMLALLEELGERHPGLAEAWQAVRELPEPHYSDEQWAVLLALFRLLPVAVAELRRLFAERGQTDYTEVALAALAALGKVDDPADLALALDHRISHILIDEMQDTSFAQYALLEKLVAGWEPGDGRTLFCVGDPMQSIYRFRDAEVGQFLLARKAGIGPVRLEPLVLRRNFRSGADLVQRYNDVFSALFPAADDVAAGAIRYAASVPGAAGLEPGRWVVHPLFGADREREAERGLEAIQECLRERSGASTAVLVRGRAHLPELLARLRAAGIGYRALDIDRLTELPEIIDLLALTRALCHRGDRIAWLGLLRGPWAGLDWRDLHALTMNDSRHTVWELLQDHGRIAGLSAEGRARAEAFRRQLTPFLEGHGAETLRETVERAWFALRGPLLLRSPDEADNVYRYLDLLERAEVAGTLPDVAELESLLDEERVSGSVNADCPLQIMTMHKAKGLQFDHVVLYGLGRTSARTRQSLLGWLNLPAGDGGTAMIVSPVGALAELAADPLHKLIERAGRAKEELELDRLLYVACTRARRTVHLVGHVPLAAADGSLREPQRGSLLARLWPALEPVFAAAYGRQGMPAAAPPTGGLREPVLARLSAAAELPAPQPLPPAAGAPASPSEPELPVQYRWVGSVARHAGTIVHRWLHRLATGLSHAPPADLAPLAPRSRAWAAALGVPAGETEAVCRRALDALRGVLEDERGRWVLYGPGEAELALSGLVDERVESVVIDRVRIDEHGNHWIVDYKTGAHEGGDLEGFLRQESERYRPQLERYAALYRNLPGVPAERVRTALYFPLLRRFIEVPVGGG